MKRKDLTPTWMVDYSAARAHAIRWLGDRYLLARPINASHYGSRGPTRGIALSIPADTAAATLPAPTSEAFPLASPARCS